MTACLQSSLPAGSLSIFFTNIFRLVKQLTMQYPTTTPHHNHAIVYLWNCCIIVHYSVSLSVSTWNCCCLNKLSYHRRTTRCTTSRQQLKNSIKMCDWSWSLEVIQNGTIQYMPYTTLFCAVSKISPLLQRTLTACDIEKSFSFNTTVELTGYVRCLIHAKVHMCYILPEVCQLDRFHAAKFTFKVTYVITFCVSRRRRKM